MVVVSPLPRGTPSLATAIGVVLATAITFLAVRPVTSSAEQVVLSGRSPEQVTPRRDAPTPVNLSTYRVRRGDTVSQIARLHQVPLSAIIEHNGLVPPYRLNPGDRVVIPATEAGPPPAAAIGSPHAAKVNAAAARWGPAYRISPALMKALAWKESRWEPQAVSDKGALGVAQVLPGTARWVSARLVGEQLDPMKVDDNLRLSAAYLRWLVDRSDGDIAAGLAAYYQGPSSTLNDGWLPSTERYVRDVFALWERFRGENRAAN